MQHNTCCEKLFEVWCQSERGETSFEDERSLEGTRVQAASLETLDAGSSHVVSVVASDA